MKNSKHVHWSAVLIIGALGILLTSSAFAKGKRRPASAEEGGSSTQISSSLENLSSRRFELGISTITHVSQNMTGAISALMPMGSSGALQANLSLPQTSPFQVSGSLLFKQTVADHGSSSFHLGGGIALGLFNNNNNTAFGFDLRLLAGFQFAVPSVPRVKLHFDFGPQLYAVTGNPSQINLSLGSVSPLFGLSIFYAL